MGVINEFDFRCFALFTNALTARLNSEKKSAKKSFPFLLLAGYLPISRVMGVINELGFWCLHHFRMRLQPDKNRKNRQQKVDHFYWRKFTANLTVFAAANLLLT